jgi:hypothetical protein
VHPVCMCMSKWALPPRGSHSNKEAWKCSYSYEVTEAALGKACVSPQSTCGKGREVTGHLLEYLPVLLSSKPGGSCGDVMYQIEQSLWDWFLSLCLPWWLLLGNEEGFFVFSLCRNLGPRDKRAERLQVTHKNYLFHLFCSILGGIKFK